MKNAVVTDGDVSQITLSCINDCGHIIYITSTSSETNNTMNIIKDCAKWDAGRFNGSDTFRRNESNFMICIMSQISKQSSSSHADLSHICISRYYNQDTKRVG